MSSSTTKRSSKRTWARTWPDVSILEVAIESSGYGAVAVLGELQLSVDEGELVAVLGANGAGKTTLLRTISGLLVHGKGRISFAGSDISRLAAHRRARVGIVHVPEGRRVFPGLTVEENLRMGMYAKRRRGERTEASYDRVFDLFPILEQRRDQQASSLSGGEQQMLAIGRGLMAEPRLLMVDEASLGLSPAYTKHVFEALVQVRSQGIAVLMVEQNARGALAVADRAYILERGRVALTGRQSDLIADPRVAGLYFGGHGVEAVS